MIHNKNAFVYITNAEAESNAKDRHATQVIHAAEVMKSDMTDRALGLRGIITKYCSTCTNCYCD